MHCNSPYRYNPSMDSGFAGSNAYQNYPSTRRPPPAVPSQSPDGPPPALPPRNYNKTVYVNSDNLILSSNISNNAITTHTIPAAIHPAQIATTPSFKDVRTDEDGIDHSKKDFKSLMTQWENSSPREEGYAAKLRKEAQRWTNPKLQVPDSSNVSHLQQPLNHTSYNPQSLGQYGAQQYHPQHQQQQQQMSQQHTPSSKSTPPNATPMAVMHSRTAINFSTTYKRQPTVPQEATLPLSPTSSHPQQPSFPVPPSTNNSNIVNTAAPVPASVSPFSSSLHMASPHQMSSNSYTLSPKQPFSSSNTISTISTISTGNNNRQSVASSVGSSSASHHSPAASNISFSSSHSSNSMDITPPPRLPEKAAAPPPSSSSSPSPSQPDQKGLAVSSTAGINLSRTSPSSKDNNSNNSILDGKQSGYRSPPSHNSQSSPSKTSPSPKEQHTPHHQQQHTPPHHQQQHTPPHHQQHHQTKWKPKRGPIIPSPPLPPDPSVTNNVNNTSSNMHAPGEPVVSGDPDFPPPPPELTHQALDNADNEVFSEDSYIGHKNKTSRPIGSYKRSKSAAALPSTEKSNTNGFVDQDGASGGPFPDRKPLKPTWNSDWTLQSHDDMPPPPSSSSLSSSSSTLNPTKEDLARASTNHPTTSSSSHLTHNQQLSQPQTDPSFTSTDAPPIRPARPSASSRKELTDSTAPLSSSNSPYPSHSPSSSISSNPQSSSQYKSPVNNSSIPHHVPPDSSTAAGTPVFTAKPFVISHTQRSGVDNSNTTHNNSPRRAPPPVPNSPPFDSTRDSPLTRTHGSNLNHVNSNYPHHQLPSSSPYISPSSSSSLPMSSSILPSSSSSSSSPSSSSSSSSQSHRPWRSPDSTPPSLSNKSSYNSNVNNYPSSHASNFNNNSMPTSNSISLNNNIKTAEGQAPTLPPPREHHHDAHHRRENEALKPNPYPSSSSSSYNSLPTTPDNPEFSMLHRYKSEASGLNANTPRAGKGDNSQPSSGHNRQPSQEELECDLKAKQLAEELGDKDIKLSEVLSSDTKKKRMRYMDGLFSEVGAAQNGQEGVGSSGSFSSSRSLGSNDGVNSQRDSFGSPKQNEDSIDASKRTSLPKEYWLSAPKAQIEMTLRHSQEAGSDLARDIKDGHSLVQQKEELLKKLRKKLEVLEEDKVQLTQEIEDNNALGKQVDSMLASKFNGNPGLVEKYKTYVEDQDKIVRLLLNLSGQLARAENAVEAIPINSDSRLKKLTTDKRERLHAKHEEAKVLKADIDKRKDQLSVLIQEGLGESEWQRYIQYINKRPQLTIELQELEDKIKLGMEQMDELKKSIPNS